MVVQLSKDYEVGELEIPKGEYWVSARSDVQALNLTGKGRDFPIPATKRTSRRTFRMPSVQFHTLDGKTWALLVRIPPNEEWSAFLQEATEAKL